MFPIVTIFGREFATYALAATAGILVSGFYACRNAKKLNINQNNIIITAIFGMAGALIGSHLLYAMTNWSAVYALILHWEKLTSFDEFLQCLMYIFGGAVYYGGLLAGIMTGWIYMKRKKLDTRVCSDILAPAIPLFHAFGRVGCFFAGCCYGVPGKFGFVFYNSPLPEANGVVRFPVQLLEAAIELLIFLLLDRMLKKGAGRGSFLKIYLGLYAFVRFFLEYLRGDELRGYILGMSTSQFISLIILAVLLIKLILERKHARMRRKRNTIY